MTVWGGFVAIITEMLSAFHWITRVGLSCAWLLFILAALIVFRSTATVLGSGTDGIGTFESNSEPFGAVEFVLLGGVGLIVVLVGVTAVLSPPNTWDAMEYHMPRVAIWASNHTVQFYPTIDYPQLFQSPYAEYVMLHLYVLADGDRFVNLVQWFSWIGSILGVSLIAACFGADRKGQLLGAVAAATLPTAILGASGAKNDLVVTLWIVLTVYYLLQFGRKNRSGYLLGSSVAAGLAVFSKGTAYVFLPCLVLACWILAEATTRRKLLQLAVLLLLPTIVFNGPQYIRNYHLSGSPVGFSSPFGNGPEFANRRFRIGKPSIRGSVANIIRHVALNFGTRNDDFNEWEYRQFARVIRWTGSDPDDRDSIEERESGAPNHFRIPRFSREEVLAGDPIHFGLFVSAVVLLLAGIPRRRWNAIVFSGGVCGAFVMFCAFFRWQPTNIRYLMPLLVLSSVVIGVYFGVIPGRRFVSIGALVLVLTALPFAIANKVRPLVTVGLQTNGSEAKYFLGHSIVFAPRSEVYFGDYHLYLAPSYTEAASSFRRGKCTDVGLDASLERFEYPMMALLKREGGVKRIAYVGVHNLSKGYEVDDSQPPCAVVCLNCASHREKWEEYQRAGWGDPVIYDRIVVFQQEAWRPDISKTGLEK
jgi:hypothetical protein